MRCATYRVLLAALIATWAAGAEAAQPAPFEGYYEASVQNWRLPGDIEDVTGSQIVRLEKTCTDWKLAAKFSLRASSADGRDVDFDTDLSGTESLDGTRYRFRSETRMRGQPIALLEGQASRAAVGQAGRVQFTQPEAKAISLPHDSLFPVAAFYWTAQQWERGQKTANYVLFDGTTPDPVRVFELLTGPATKLDPPPEGDTKLLQAGPGWRTTGSFHRYSGQESEPLTTLTQSVLANGVAIDLALDIGIADVTLKLRRVRALPEPKC
jgi:hypothetical protein